MAANYRHSRRRVLQYAGAGSMVGLAGCSSLLGTGDGDNVRAVVPYGEGGGTDIYTRAIAPEIGDELDVNIEVDNVTGSGVVNGLNEVYDAEGDGSTVCFMNGPPSMAFLRPDLLGFDHTELKEGGAFARTGFVISAHPDDEVEDYEDLISRYQEGELTDFGGLAVGEGQWLLAMLMKDLHGLEWESYVSYSSSGELAQANASEEIPSGNPTETTMVGFVEDDLLTPVVASSPQGSPNFPDLPTMEEEGYETPYGDFTRGLLFPPDTDEDIINEWTGALETVLESDELQEWSDETGNFIEFMDRDYWTEQWSEGPARIEEAINEVASVESYREEIQG
ncbi:hypothetical protein CP556_22355 [Natrinema sp. CBA1119]|uniref:Bug family tripartite tricarboxylate transporter substrate binding protein n=1 Tax=Natrinema sp. CBA1119 TaxID=1608465 RepID=UPI000BF2949F|nr:tripartite tricarboxylate transporter substrate-binding protein [Natrinema sp. CBA1119]PGF13848.1 hypothetical protein CP556_22355 [Natrinema sp. CBA1119]